MYLFVLLKVFCSWGVDILINRGSRNYLLENCINVVRWNLNFFWLLIWLLFMCCFVGFVCVISLMDVISGCLLINNLLMIENECKSVRKM